MEYTATRLIKASLPNEDELGRLGVSWEMPKKSCMVHLLFKVSVVEPTSISWSWRVVTDSMDLID